MWAGFWAFMIVCAVLVFVLVVIRMGMRYYENKARMERGYPTLDGSPPPGSDEGAAAGNGSPVNL